MKFHGLCHHNTHHRILESNSILRAKQWFQFTGDWNSFVLLWRQHDQIMILFLGHGGNFQTVWCHEKHSTRIRRYEFTWKKIKRCKSLILCKPIVFLILDQEPQTDLVAQLSQEFYNSDIFEQILNNLAKLDFEVRIEEKIPLHN